MPGFRTKIVDIQIIIDNNIPVCNKKNKSRCIVINYISVNLKNRNIAKHILNFMTLLFIVNSSVSVTNNFNDHEYLSKFSEKMNLRVSSENGKENKLVNSQAQDSANMQKALLKKKLELNLKKGHENIKRSQQTDKNLKKSDLKDKQNSKVSINKPGNSKVNISSDVKLKSIEANYDKKSKKETIITGYATAYTAGPKARTANGRTPVAGFDCAMNKKYLNRKIEATVNGKKYNLTVTDHGKAVNSNNGTILDIYMNSYNECITFGRQPVSVRFID